MHKDPNSKGFVKIYRARINIIGHSRAGKTSLLRKLLGQPFQVDARRTEGIAIHVIKSDFCDKGKKTRKWSETDSKETNKLVPLMVLKQYLYAQVAYSEISNPLTSHKIAGSPDAEFNAGVLVPDKKTLQPPITHKVFPKLSDSQ